MCIAVPSDSGAKPFIIAVVILQVLDGLLAAAGAAGTEPNVGFVIIGGLARLASFVLLQLFLRTLALYLGRKDLATWAFHVLFGIPVIGLIMGAGIGMTAVIPGSAVLGIIFLVIAAVASISMIVLGVRNLNLIYQLGKAARG